MIALVAALQCELFHLIESLKLQKVTTHPFTIYANETYVALISGVGGIASATSVGFLANRFKNIQSWLNIGIAGHRDIPVSEMIHPPTLCHSGFSTKHFPTRFAPFTQLRSIPIQTVDTPLAIYPHEMAVEMESYYFFTAARKFAPSDLIQICKVISDNTLVEATALTKKRVLELFEPHTPFLLEAIEVLHTHMQDMHPHPPLFEICASKYHFSTTQLHELKHLLFLHNDLTIEMLDDIDSGASLLTFLKQRYTPLPL